MNSDNTWHCLSLNYTGPPAQEEWNTEVKGPKSKYLLENPLVI